MATLSWVPRINVQTFASQTPTINTSAYTAGDQVGGFMTLTNIIRQDSNLGFGTSILTSVTIIDAGKQAAPFDILFFNQSPTLVSANNDPFSQTVANAKIQYIGKVSVAGSYLASASYSTSTDDNLNLPVRALSGSSLFAVAVTTGTPTYVGTTDLTFEFNFLVD